MKRILLYLYGKSFKFNSYIIITNINNSIGGYLRMNTNFDLKALLDIIFKVTKKNASIMADCYLLKDKSIISKWKNSSLAPRNDDIDGIIKFVLNESTCSQQRIIRDSIEQLIKDSTLKKELKEIILGSNDFSSFLAEALSVSISAKDINSEIETLPCEDNISANTVTGHLENKSGRYKGTLEFDLVIPNASNVKSVNSLEKAGIEFNGKVNLNPKSRIINAAKYLKKTSVLGLIFACIVSGSLIAHSNNQKNNTFGQGGSINRDLIQDTTHANTPVITPSPVIKPTLTPVVTPVVTPVLTSEPTAEKVIKKKPSNNSRNEINSVVNTTEVTIHGDKNIYFNGNNNVIDID